MSDSRMVDCPECGKPFYCPCAACQGRHGQDVVWKWVTPNGPIKCGYCGIEIGVEEFSMLELETYQRESG
ncbi:MAG: hypothetical protein GY718_10160 [Lentisphaerae bacterium]|nr:hypothetical protein [Lentisphaerota bacterium]